MTGTCSKENTRHICLGQLEPNKTVNIMHSAMLKILLYTLLYVLLGSPIYIPVFCKLLQACNRGITGLSRLNTHDRRQQANEALQIQLHSGNSDIDWISCLVEHSSP
jgi:hypothetical protein